MSATKATFIVVVALVTLVVFTISIGTIGSNGKAQASEDGYGISAIH